jgi:NitT/TauT family transport system ATP-binding protein
VQQTRPLVTLSRVEKAYASGTVALRALSLDVREREFVSLLGPSGCGKTTVLRLIAGLGGVTGGAIEWPPEARERGKRDIGFVFQEPTLMPWATVLDNVWTPLRVAGQSRAAARDAVQAAIAMVGLDGFERAHPRELSGGMKMRVSIARALVTRPRLLLMDEPFAALDEITRFRLNNDLLSLWASQHLTVVFVTHSVYESVFLSSRILVMSARPGRIVDEVDIAAPYPRDAGFRATALYHERCTHLSRRLEEAMRG